MAAMVSGSNSIKNEIEMLMQPGALQLRLIDIDAQSKPLKRIFVMGCGRSGTWLLTGIMSTFSDLEVIADEVDAAMFGLIKTEKQTLVLKRNHRSYQTVIDVPQSINIVHIVRHPFDVLTSTHHRTPVGFHIQPDRWLGEMRSLQHLMQTKRPNTVVIRYEDVVSDPMAIQLQLSEVLGLTVNVAATQFMETFKPPAKAVASMHGVRQIDTKSVNRWKTDPLYRDYLTSILPQLGADLSWMAEQFHYDVKL